MVSFEHQFSLTYSRMDFDTEEWIAVNEIDPFDGYIGYAKENMDYEEPRCPVNLNYIEKDDYSLEEDYRYEYEHYYDRYVMNLTTFKNSLLALHGHDFEDESTREYFMPQVWYLPIKNKKVSVDELNQNERFYYDQAVELLSRERPNDM